MVNTLTNYKFQALLTAVAALMLVPAFASAATINVPSDHATVGAAVSAASAGDTITVDPGSYDSSSQVVIDKDLTITGSGKNVTTLTTSFDTSTSGDARGWFLVEPNVTLHLSDLTMNGAGQKVWQAIRNKGEGSVDDVHFTNITYFNNSTDGQPYNGNAIAAFGTGPVNVSNSDFDNIGRIGVLYFGDGADGSIFSNNTYVGKGTGDYLDYALDISAGIDVTVTGNTISNNKGVASSDSSTSAGILVSTFFGGETSALIENNYIFDNTTGIAVGFDGNDVSSVEAHQNCIVGNENGVVSTAPEVDAINNWWGAADGPSGVGSGSGDSVDDNILFDPWLTEPAAACAEPEEDIDGTSVSNNNSAVVINETEASASTGGNYAGGSYGGDGGNGGDIENDGDDQDVDDSSTGNGGRGGDGARGGLVNSGNAYAGASTINSINTNITRVNRCGCDGDDEGDTTVHNRNRAFLYNETEADAKTGRNAASGSRGGDAGNGGDIENDGGDDQDVDDSSTGTGGNAGNGGVGGTVVSGHAESYAETLNRVNRNTTRIRR